MTFPQLNSQSVLSPMAGVTDIAFRSMAADMGAGMTYTEFVSCAAIVRGSKKTLDMIRVADNERPVAVQLFGNNINEVVAAAKMLEDTFDVFDINCGCPAWKVIKTGAGSQMLNNPQQIGEFIHALSRSITKPVTLKIRSGIDAHSINAVTVATVAQKAGASAIAVHGRTQKQGYRGLADWHIIKKVKQAVDIPVIGNGDVFSPQDFVEKLHYSGVDAIMIARGAIGNPFIFEQINQFLTTGSYQDKPDDLFLQFLEYAQRFSIDFSSVKSHGMAFSKGLSGGAQHRRDISGAEDKKKKKKIFEDYITGLSNSFK